MRRLFHKDILPINRSQAGPTFTALLTVTEKLTLTQAAKSALSISVLHGLAQIFQVISEFKTQGYRFV